eukprot:TRINITY_DN25928_c0_g1_i2.p2 TRINITY_DN25928_c0_g1~~TRINITY_DN25928_c0_g1_i2.p2  ORF type:complete len:126 (+),score=47.65 TRINITY_DN25928_c0_g1_i2:597-974(+)
MLAEKKMRPVPWEKALTELIYDDRYSALPKEYRKLVYDEYMKRGNVERMREEVKTKEMIEAQVRAMMEEYRRQGKITATIEYRKFEELVKNDMQFLKLLQADKGGILREFINEVEKAKNEGMDLV